jgi:hypothetical protein
MCLDANEIALESPMETGVVQRSVLFSEALETYRKLEKYSDRAGLLGPDEAPFTRQAWALLPFYPLYRILAGLSVLSYPRYRYVQGQAYWIIGNLFLFRKLRQSSYLENAEVAGKYLVESQSSDGSWRHPLPGWRDRISTVYCLWGGLSMIKLYYATDDERYLNSALRWKRCLLQKVGVQNCRLHNADFDFVRYFYPIESVACPNVSTLALAFLSNLISYLDETEWQLTRSLLRSIRAFQLPSGEIPYTASRVHYQCQSYNAFEFIDLFEYARNVESPETTKILEGIARFLAQSVSAQGQVGYDCSNKNYEVKYHTMIVAAALHYSSLLHGDTNLRAMSDRILSRIYAWPRWYREDHGLFRIGPFMIRDRAFFARQSTYCLVSLLRLAIISDTRLLDDSVM